MPQQGYDSCTGCGRMFQMDKEWFVYLLHDCDRHTTKNKEQEKEL